MPTHSETRRLPYSPDQMYRLVADVNKYPEFLPWCSAARVRSRELESKREIMLADLVISFKVSIQADYLVDVWDRGFFAYNNF